MIYMMLSLLNIEICTLPFKYSNYTAKKPDLPKIDQLYSINKTY